MKIHYISCHSVLEYDEVSMFAELGYTVFSNGAYSDPRGHFTLPRPSIKGLEFYPKLFHEAVRTPKTNLTEKLIEPFDAVIIMHDPEVVLCNWNNIKHKKVIWRSIGQSTSGVEKKLERCRKEGLKIVRYSPKEKNIKNYIGEDTIIRFGKSKAEFANWHGKTDEAINFTQSLKGRRDFVHYEEIYETLKAVGGLVYGTGNNDLGTMNGGELPYKEFKKKLQEVRCFVYGGTYPAPYTLSLIEAMMTGLPIVTISKKLAHKHNFEKIDFFEADEIVENGVSGFVCDSVDEMIKKTRDLMHSREKAKKMSENARSRAISLFEKEKIKKQWKDFLLML